jgi:DNA-binding NarL/FixJ family response regulator
VLNNITIILLDDHSLFINGMKSIISNAYKNVSFRSFNSIGEFKDAKLKLVKFDIFISDLELPNEDIFSFFKEIKSSSDIPILVISMHQKISLVRKCISIGIDGYILKNDDEYLIIAVQEILQGKKYFSPKIRRLLNDYSLQKKLLSEREEQVIKYICEGQSNSMIAKLLKISIETVKTHKKNIKIKLGVSETHELIDFAKKNILF